MMNERQKKEHIKALWKKVRFYVMTKGSFQHIMRVKEAKRRERFGLDTDRSAYLPEEQELESQLVYEDDSIQSTLPGYIINPESTFSKVKNVWVQSITWTNLIITPVGFVFSDQVGEQLEGIEWIVDVAWTVEILMSFLTATYNDRTLKQISFSYLKFWFWVDSISTFPAMITL